MSEWISVKDRVPEQFDFVITFDGSEVHARYFQDGSFMGSGGEVTHWMPLPEPPK